MEQIVRLILTEAGPRDLEMLQEAVARRRDRLSPEGGTERTSSPANMARDVAEGVGRQVRQSMQQVHGMVREAVAGIIRHDAPELTPEQVQALLEAWVPDEAGREPESRRGPAAGAAGGQGEAERSPIPAPALLSMVRQFVAYSTGSMSSAEQTQLRAAIPDWPRRYWQRFPSSVRELVTSLLREKIGAQDFWEAVRIRLFEPVPPPAASPGTREA